LSASHGASRLDVYAIPILVPIAQWSLFAGRRKQLVYRAPSWRPARAWSEAKQSVVLTLHCCGALACRLARPVQVADLDVSAPAALLVAISECLSAHGDAISSARRG
jgi:hypothetical protein